MKLPDLLIILVMTLIGLALIAAVFPAHAGTSCRSHRMGSTTYTKCDDGRPSTPPVSCRTYKVGSTTYSACS